MNVVLHELHCASRLPSAEARTARAAPQTLHGGPEGTVEASRAPCVVSSSDAASGGEPEGPPEPAWACSRIVNVRPHSEQVP